MADSNAGASRTVNWFDILKFDANACADGYLQELTTELPISAPGTSSLAYYKGQHGIMDSFWVTLGAFGFSFVAMGCVYVSSGGSEGPIFRPLRTMRERQVRDNREPPSRSDVVEQPGAIGPYSTTAPIDDSSAMFRGYDVVNAILEVAHHLAQRCPFPGVCEAATLVPALVILISEDQQNMAETASRLRRCHLLITMLQRAATVLVEINSIEDTDSSTSSKRMLIKNVRDAIGNMVDMIKAYRSKRRITQVVVSALFHRRMEEAETAIDRTFDDMMRWLQIDLARSQEEDRRYLNGFRRNLTAAEEDAMEVLHRQQQFADAKSIAAARRLRRKRNLNQIEIPEDQVTISEDLLGKGGFGSVFIADYNGRNVAAKVIQIDLGHCLGSSRADDDVGMETKNGEANEHRQRASILLELQTMMRLRSPHTVNVYGAITSRRDRLVLVMELLTGGDLTSLLRHSKERLSEAQARRIIGDVKSANVLLDGEGRAKIGDFGTSRWAQRSGYIGLATYKTSEGKTMHMMSFTWAAPEVFMRKFTAGTLTVRNDLWCEGITTGGASMAFPTFVGEIQLLVETPTTFFGVFSQTTYVCAFLVPFILPTATNDTAK